MKKDDNVGKCGHPKCAGGNLCYYKGKPMREYKPVCVKHGLEIEYTQNRCVQCMDETPTHEL